MPRSLNIFIAFQFCSLIAVAQHHPLERGLDSTASEQNIKDLRTLTLYYAVKDSSRALLYGNDAIRMSVELNMPLTEARACLDIGKVYQENFEYDQAEGWLRKAETIYESENSVAGKALVNEARGFAEVKQGYHEKSIATFSEALIGFESVGDTEHILKSCYNLGYAHYRLRNFDSTIHYYFKVLPHCDEELSANCIDVYNQLGATYTEIKEFSKANTYLRLALNASLQRGDSVNAANAVMNIAGNYFFQNKLDSCAWFLDKAIGIYEATGDLQGKVLGLNNLSIIYEENNDLKNALLTAFKALEAGKKINDRNTVAGSYIQVMDLSRKTGNLKQSLHYGDSAIVIIKALKSKYHYQQYYLSLSEAYKALNDYRSAMKYKELYYAYADSMVNEQKNKQIAALEVQYETEKKEQQITLLSKEKELQSAAIESNRASIISLVILIIGGFGAGFWFLKRNQYKQRIAMEQEKSRQREQQIKAVITSQEKERKRFAMDLHDDFGQLIAALKLNVSNFKAISKETNITEKSGEILDKMYSSLKNIAFDLMPHTLFEKGLEEAVDDLSEQVNASDGIKISFQSFGIGDKISSDQKVAVYRIIQELISNILKYSNATKINISITDLGQSLSLMIDDDGHGFEINKFKNGSGNGWKNIHSRLNLLHGEIEFDTLEGRKNTTVSIEIPYGLNEKMTIAQ